MKFWWKNLQIIWNLVVWIINSVIEKSIIWISKIFLDYGRKNCQSTPYYSLMYWTTEPWIMNELLIFMPTLHLSNDNKTLHHQFIQAISVHYLFLLSCEISQMGKYEERMNNDLEHFAWHHTFMPPWPLFKLFMKYEN